MHIQSGPEYIKENIKALYTFEKGGQEIAMLRLIKAGKPAVLPLLDALQQLEEDPSNGILYSYSFSYSFEERQEIRESIRDAMTDALVGIKQEAVAPLVGAIKSDSKTRELAARILNRIGEPAVEPLLELIQHPSDDVRAAAALALAGIHDERAVSALQHSLRKAILAHRLNKNREIKRRVVSLLCIVSLLGLVTHFVHETPFVIWQIMIQVFVIGSIADTTLALRRNTVSSMAKTAAPQMVGAFAACLDDRDKSVQREATEALKRLLPKVKASDKQHITAAEMNSLLKRLGGKDHRLTLAILKALEQIGDERALPKVEAIASEHSTYPVEVMLAAQECLPYLRQLAEASRQAHTLLRASESTTAPETLLRAASGTTTEKPDQLLRPQS